MRPRNKKIQYDLISNKSRSMLVILAIAVGLFATGMIMTLWIVIPSDLRIGYEQSNPANIYFRLSNFDNNLIRSVKKWDGVLDAMGSSVGTMRIYDKNNDLKKVTVKAVSDEAYPINRINILEGKWPIEKGEAAFENYKFKALGLKLGDYAVFKTNSGKEVSLRIVATVRDESLGAADQSVLFLEPINAYISVDSLRKMEMSEEWTMLRVTVEGNRNDLKHIETLSAKFGDRFEKAGYAVHSTAARLSNAHPTVDYVDAIVDILLAIGVLVLFLSGSLIYNTLKAILNNQMRQIGAMKTIGATYRQIVFMFMRLILIYSLIALAIAIPASYFAAEACRKFLSASINFTNIRTGIVHETIIMQVALGLIVPQIAGAIPVSKGARVSIKSAMGGMATSQAGDVRPSKMMNWMSKLFSRPSALSMRNTFRNKSRLLLTLFTLSLGGAIFIGSFNVNESINRHIANISRYFQADLDVQTENPYRLDRMREILKDIDGIKYVEAWGSGSAKFMNPDGSDGPLVSVLAPPADSDLIDSTMTLGRWYGADEANAIALNERFLFAYPALKPGDVIELDINETGGKTKWTISGFFSLAGKSGGFVAYMPYSSWVKNAGVANRATKFQVVTTERVTKHTLNWYVNEIETELERKGVKVKVISTNNTFVDDAASGLNILAVFMMIMAVLVAIVGSIGLTGTMSLNVMERTSEIGILRAIGASNRAVMKNVLTEGLIIGILSWIVGALLSFPIGRLLTRLMGNAIFGSSLAQYYSWVGYALWLAISIVFSLLASGAPARDAAKLTIQEVLSVE